MSRLKKNAVLNNQCFFGLYFQKTAVNPVVAISSDSVFSAELDKIPPSQERLCLNVKFGSFI